MVERKGSSGVEREPFLLDFNSADPPFSIERSHAIEDSRRQGPRKKTNIGSIFRVYIVLIHVALAAAFWDSRRWQGQKSAREGSFSPAWDGIVYEIRENHAVSHSAESPYAGPPSPEANQAWDSLIFPTYVRMSKEEMIAAGESLEGSLELEEGGYVGVTSAYHELHCVRQLRLYLYKETHYPNLTLPQEEYLRGHLDHCLEVLREEIMCTGDVSIYTFFWGNPPRSRPDTKTASKRSCVNWEKLEKWSLEHMVLPHAATKGGLSPLWIKEKTHETADR